jgi:hypothetical protein
VSNRVLNWLVTVSASGTLFDPELGIPGMASAPLRAVSRETRVDLFGGDLILHFREDRINVFVSNTLKGFFFHPLLYFLIYRTRIQYQIFWPSFDSKPPDIAPSSDIVFALQRWTEVRVERAVAGRTEIFSHYEPVPAPITVQAAELENLIRFCTPKLYMSLVYYLLGCENRRYFLVEFYKALEVIENAFGGETKAIEALKGFGVERSRFKGLKQVANDYQRPFDIGRHAPKGGDVRSVDLRRMLEDPVSKQLFSDSVVSVRQAIDGYFASLCGSG